MTQAKIIRALQNGPLTSTDLANLLGKPKSTILAACKKMRYKGELTTEEVKVGSFWMAQYTLADHLLESKQKSDDEETRCKLNPFDIRNAKGIFTPTEYRVMAAQARRLYGGNPNFTANK